MKTIAIQEGDKVRLLLYPETSADEYLLELMQGCHGQAKLIPIEAKEVERVVNPYKESNGNGNEKPAILVEMDLKKIPKVTYAEETKEV